MTDNTSDVRALVKSLHSKPHTARRVKSVLGSLYATMMDEEIVTENPARGIRVPKIDREPFTALTPEDFKKIVEHLPSEELRFFAKFLVGSGMRYGEAAAIHVDDFNPDTNEVKVRRRLMQVSKKHSGQDDYLFTQPSTKSGHSRVVPLSPMLAEEFKAMVALHNLAEVVFRADVMFPLQTTQPPRGEWWEVMGLDSIFRDETHFQHGTTRSYRRGQCRCDLCSRAEAYERSKSTRKRAVYMDWRRWDKVWKAAVKDAGLSWSPRTHDLRHAHATILVASGVDIYEVQRRLGHASITTTQTYLHRVDAMKSQTPTVLALKGPGLRPNSAPRSPSVAVGPTLTRRCRRLPYRMRPLTAPSQPTWPRPTRRRRTGRSRGRRRALPLTPPTSTPRVAGSHKGHITAPSSTL